MTCRVRTVVVGYCCSSLGFLGTFSFRTVSRLRVSFCWTFFLTASEGGKGGPEAPMSGTASEPVFPDRPRGSFGAPARGCQGARRGRAPGVSRPGRGGLPRSGPGLQCSGAGDGGAAEGPRGPSARHSTREELSRAANHPISLARRPGRGGRQVLRVPPPKSKIKLLSDPDPKKARRAMKAMLQMRKIDIKALQA